MSDNSDNNTPHPDLSALTDFQFGPSWARNKDSEQRREFTAREPRGDRGDKSGGRRDDDRRGGKPFSRDREGGSPYSRDRFQGDRRNDRFPRGDRNDRGDRGPRSGQGDRDFRDRKFDRNSRPERPPLEPTPGIRVEIRPVDAGLASVAEKIQRHKRSFSLYDLAKFFMGARDRYEIWYIKEENGPEVFFNKKTPAIWLTEQEAIASLWGSPLMKELYAETIEEVEAPKGQFTAIGRCGMSDTLIGPVNWHGYQQAVAKLHAERFPNVPFERFRSRIVVEKSEEALAQWMEAATKKSVWAPKREGAAETVLRSRKEMEEDFLANHFLEVFEKTGKCHVLGDIAGRSLSQGLFAHLLKLTETARRHPAQIIPNICHGLARHHLPIFKWNGGHHTGPSRPHALPTDTKLATRPAAIVEWVKEHPGKTIDIMINTLIDIAEANAAKPEVPAPVSTDSPAIQEETTSTNSLTSSETMEVEVTASEIPESVMEEAAALDTASSEEVFSSETAQETTFDEISSTPEEPAKKASEEAKEVPAGNTMTKAQTEWLTDLLWLLQQGFVLVTADGKAYWPKAEPASNKQEQGSAKKPKKKKAKKAPSTEKPSEAGKKPKKDSVKVEAKQETAAAQEMEPSAEPESTPVEEVAPQVTEATEIKSEEPVAAPAPEATAEEPAKSTEE